MSKGLFHLDEQLRIREQHWSETIAQQAVWLYGPVEDDLAEQILQKIGGLTISYTSIWRRAHKWSEKIHVAETARANTAFGLPHRGQLIRGQVPHERPMGVAMDAGKINIRIMMTSRCGLGNTSPKPVLSSIDQFPVVYASHLGECGEGLQACFSIQKALEESRRIAKRTSMIYDPVYGVSSDGEGTP